MSGKLNGKIALEHGPAGSYIVCACSGEPGRMDWDETDPEISILVQSDWDFPGLASAFGWVACDCGDTDGTCDCPHRTAGDMISSAAEYLDGVCSFGREGGAIAVDDPGYF